MAKEQGGNAQINQQFALGETLTEQPQVFDVPLDTLMYGVANGQSVKMALVDVLASALGIPQSAVAYFPNRETAASNVSGLPANVTALLVLEGGNMVLRARAFATPDPLQNGQWGVAFVSVAQEFPTYLYGGGTGEILTKASAADLNFDWSSPQQVVDAATILAVNVQMPDGESVEEALTSVADRPASQVPTDQPGVSVQDALQVDSAQAYLDSSKIYPMGARVSAKTGEAWDIVPPGTANSSIHPKSGQTIRAVPSGAVISAPAIKDPFSRNITDAAHTALARGQDFLVPYDGQGAFIVSDTIEIGRQQSVKGNGLVILDFDNTDEGKEMFRFGYGYAGHNKLAGMTLRDKNPFTSTLYSISGDADLGGAQWKNYFERMYGYRFGVGVHFKGEDREDWASENAWMSCKFVNCKIGILAENDQALNNTFYQTDFENYDDSDSGTTDDQFTILKMTRGGGFNFHGCSLIGRGKFLHYVPGANSTHRKPFSGAIVNVTDCRAELRNSSPADPQFTTDGWIYQDPSGNYSDYRWLDINVKGMKWVVYGGQPDILRYARNLQVQFSSCEASGGRVIAKQYPVANSYSFATSPLSEGRTALVGARSRVVIGDDCSGISYRHGGVFGDVTEYGTIDTTRAAPVLNSGQGFIGAISQIVDADGFIDYASGPSASEMGRGYMPSEPRRMVYNNYGEIPEDEVKFIAPYKGRPVRWGIYKVPNTYTVDCNYELRIVKNKAQWTGTRIVDGVTVPAPSFPNDSYLLGSTGSLANQAGGREYDISFPSNGAVLGTGVAQLSAEWLEGRMIFRRVGGSGPRLIGNFWVEYW